jgi:hypothetical protein
MDFAEKETGRPRCSPAAWLAMITATLFAYGALLFFWQQWQTLWMLPTTTAPWFPDAYAVLAASDLHAAGYDPYGANPLLVRHMYPRAWFGLSYLGLNRNDALWLGLALGAAFLGTALIWLKPRNFWEAAYAVAILVSPPITLGFQRGNADMVIALVMGGLVAALRGKSAVVRNGAGLVLLTIATLLKFYPAVTAGVVIWNEMSWRRRLGTALLVFLTLGCIGWPLVADYRRIASTTQLGGLGQNGIYVFGADFSLPLGMVAWVGMAAVATALWAGWSKLAPKLPALSRDSASLGFMVGAILLLGCFFAGNSYAYRLVFVLMMIPWWWRMWTEKTARGLRAMAAAGLILTLLLLWRDAGVALALQYGRDFFGIDFHNAVAIHHRMVLAWIGWMWCGLVACWLIAMVRKLSLAKAS